MRPVEKMRDLSEMTIFEAQIIDQNVQNGCIKMCMLREIWWTLIYGSSLICTSTNMRFLESVVFLTFERNICLFCPTWTAWREYASSPYNRFQDLYKQSFDSPKIYNKYILIHWSILNFNKFFKQKNIYKNCLFHLHSFQLIK